jgi:DNA-directed RNA polymerase subunit L
MEQFIFDSPNDQIDIWAEPKVKLKSLPPEDPDNPDSFRVQLEGDSIDRSVSNAIRITILKRIPIYGFHRHNIHIDNEKSYNMYNNDMIFNQIETLPIYDIPNYFDLEDPEVFLPDVVMKEIFGRFMETDGAIDTEISKTKGDPNKKLFHIELTLSTKNTTDTYKWVSTHDVILQIDGKNSKTYLNKDPVCILVLKPGEEISLRAEANLGMAMFHAIYEATTNVVSKEINTKKYEIIYESLGQLNKNIIFQKACIIMIRTLENLNTYVKKKYGSQTITSDYVEFALKGGDHAIGNLIATTLQKCEFILEAGYAQPHPFVDTVVIKYRVKPKPKSNPIKLFTDVIAYLITLFEIIKHEASKLK